jgi:hypothetical protein
MARRKLDPHTTDPRDPLELLARMLVGGSYRVPVEGRSTRGPALDVAGAAGMMKNRLASQVATCVVTRAGPVEVARLSRMAYRRVVREVLCMRACPLHLKDGADRWRLRMVLYDAAHELVWPEKHRTFGELARAAKMRKASYIRVHKLATSVLQQALDQARTALRHQFRG